MTPKEHIGQGRENAKNGDWDDAIANFTLAIQNAKEDGAKVVDAYFERAKARCFQDSKKHLDGDYGDVIDDASLAIAAGNAEAKLVRAYAYYLNGVYEAAENSCEEYINTHQDNKRMLASAYEILGNIRLKHQMREAKKNDGKEGPVACFKKAITFSLDAGLFMPSLNLLEKYREACKKQRMEDAT